MTKNNLLNTSLTSPDKNAIFTPQQKQETFMLMNRLKNLTKKEKLAILEFEELLLEKYPKQIKKIVLFGSKARGNFNRFSDVDILVIIPKSNRQIRKGIAGLTHEPIARFGVDLSPIIIEEKELQTYSPFVNRLKKEGVTLWSKTKKNL